MATFDQLPPDQRAILELVVKRGQSYRDLADMLGMPTGRVRELARQALTDLSPRSAGRVDPDWRGQVADYLLGQQTGPESTATRGHLKRSEAARLWALSLLDSLDHLFQGGDVPEIPEGEAAPERERPSRQRPPRERPSLRTSPLSGGRERAPKRPSRPLSADAQEIVRRRRIAGGSALAALLLLALLVWPVGLLTGGDDDDGGGAAEGGDNGSEQQSEEPRVLGQILLRPEDGEKGVGIALIAEAEDGERSLLVQGRRLPRTQEGEAYEVWLYNSNEDAESMGAQLTDRRGNYQGAGTLPEDYEKYEFLDISRETVDDNAAHSGDSVLRGSIAELQPSAGSGELEDPEAAPEGE